MMEIAVYSSTRMQLFNLFEILNLNGKFRDTCEDNSLDIFLP